MMEIGVDSFAAVFPDAATGKLASPADRMADLLEEVEIADRVGLDVFGIGEHHRAEFLDSASAIILAAAAAWTSRIRLTSAVTVLSAADPVRVFQEFATLDLISRGRAELVVGRGSFVEAFPLFGLDTRAYDDLFAEKLDLFLKLGEMTNIAWRGRHRSELQGEGVFPRPHQPRLPVWLGVGGTPQSFARAGALGLPLMVAIIGGNFERFRPLVDLYRDAGIKAGHSRDKLVVGVHVMGFVGETDTGAREAFFPGWAHLTGTIGRERGWPTPNTRAVRYLGELRRSLPDRRSKDSGREDARGKRNAWWPIAHHVPDEHCGRGHGGVEAFHRAFGRRGRADRADCRFLNLTAMSGPGWKG